MQWHVALLTLGNTDGCLQIFFDNQVQSQTKSLYGTVF